MRVFNLFNLGCKHNWKLISETVTKSRFEDSMNALKNSGGIEKTSEMNLPHQLCHADRKHIQVFSCEKCGKLKRYCEDIFFLELRGNCGNILST